MFYRSEGKLPKKKHTTFYKEGSKELYWEELFSTRGFSGVYSTKYHRYLPTQVEQIRAIDAPNPKYCQRIWEDAALQYYHFMTERHSETGDYISARNVFLENSSCRISTAKITEASDQLYRNAYAHEMIFVHHGSGEVLSEYGSLPFTAGDYLVLPKGTTYQMKFDKYSKVDAFFDPDTSIGVRKAPKQETRAANKLFIVESSTPFNIPGHFRNEYGQMLEHAPYCERDFRTPELFSASEQERYAGIGDISMILKAEDKFLEYKLTKHPFDLVGWDGYLYPFAFNIKDYCPVVGKIHLPPPVHLVFQTETFVVCNFVPRLFDFHSQAVPAPYYHSNVDSDEVLYYVDGNFMSRSGIEEGSVTLHPGGIPHGPQPGKIEKSVGVKETYEYAVMIDTFSALEPTINVKETMVDNYSQSWLVK